MTYKCKTKQRAKFLLLFVKKTNQPYTMKNLYNL